MTWCRFEPVRLRAVKSGKCARCGKTHQRAKQFEATINPYNRNIRGQIKSREEVWDDLKALAAKWKQEPIEPCQPRMPSEAGVTP